MTEVAGVIGLGIMGGAMARNLIKAGWRIVGFDIDEGARKAAEEAGVTLADSAAAVAEEAVKVITSLPSPAAAHAVAQELAGVKKKRIVVETSTLALEDKEEIRQTLEKGGGHIVLDCPLSGTGAQAQTGDLVVYASGNSAAITSLMPMFAGFSREAHDLGQYGNGSKMKFVANLLVAIHNVASAEAMVLAEKAGLDLEQVVKLISAGAANSRIFELRAPMMAKNHYLPATMRLSTWQKDMAVIGKFAAGLGSPTPLFSSTIPVYSAGNGMGLGDLDVAATMSVLETMSGVKRD